jgi:membrane associated rhomboid family serine protease
VTAIGHSARGTGVSVVLPVGGLAVVLAGVFAFTHMWWPGQLPGGDPRVAILLLERSPALWTLGEPWRAVTSFFVHVSATHVATSGAALAWWFVWAAKTSGALGAERRAVVGLLVAVACNAALAALSPVSAAGASLWIAVLVGESFARARSGTPGGHLTEAGLGVAVLLASSVVVGVDHVGHALGVGAGFALGLVSTIAERPSVERSGAAQRPNDQDARESVVMGGRSGWRTAATCGVVALSLVWGTSRAVRCAASGAALESCVAPLLEPGAESGSQPGDDLLNVE